MDEDNTIAPIVNLQSIKDALRIDGTEDDQTIEDYIDVAKSYIAGAVNGDQSSLERYPQYSMAVSLLVQFWYSNRNVDMKQTPYQVVSMIQQLRGLTWN